MFGVGDAIATVFKRTEMLQLRDAACRQLQKV
jgi:hypothetical protein